MFSVFFLCHLEPCIVVSAVSLQYCTSKMKGLVVVVYGFTRRNVGWHCSYTAGIFWTDICVRLSGSAGQCSRGSDCHCLCNTVCRSSGKELMIVWMDFSNLSRSSSFTGSWCFLALICVGQINEERSFMQMSM